MDETTLTNAVRIILKCSKWCVRWTVVSRCFDDRRNDLFVLRKAGNVTVSWTSCIFSLSTVLNSIRNLVIEYIFINFQAFSQVFCLYIYIYVCVCVCVCVYVCVWTFFKGFKSFGIEISAVECKSCIFLPLHHTNGVLFRCCCFSGVR